MATKKSKLIWSNGTLVPWENATVHVLSHALHYGSSVFEGVRVYNTPAGSRAFRLSDHIERLFNSAALYRIEIPFSQDEIIAACAQAVLENGLNNGAYIRPIAFRGDAGLGVAAPAGSPVEVAIAAMEWGAYLGAEGLAEGVDVCVSSWQRVAPNTIPAGVKAGGNYLSSQLISMEAKRLGFAEGIGLATDGTVSEGAGENLFMVKDGVLYTPSSSASILGGITRDTIMMLARDAGLEVIEQAITREALYFADELFFTGTAAEVTPIRSVDRMDIGAGCRGPVTEQLQTAFFGLFSGQTEDKRGWLQELECNTPSYRARVVSSS
ncbi:MAG: branched-chain amino acid transaminase [Gammaproteobacteria bacterium]|nr:branched-chain amino acid transaminase [Gammaproteobacteria bacterium]MDH3768282.1 branched-chain amino acid transaminase [Gammaproteobacteria bacterium]